MLVFTKSRFVGRFARLSFSPLFSVLHLYPQAPFLFLPLLLSHTDKHICYTILTFTEFVLKEVCQLTFLSPITFVLPPPIRSSSLCFSFYITFCTHELIYYTLLPFTEWEGIHQLNPLSFPRIPLLPPFTFSPF